MSVCVSGSQFEQTSATIRLPDDCTVGFIVEKRLGISMVHCPLFHSHLENLLLISQRSIPHQAVTHTHTHTHTHAYICSSANVCVCVCVCVFSTAGDFELWDVWEQDEQHRGERKLLQRGRPLQVCLMNQDVWASSRRSLWWALSHRSAALQHFSCCTQKMWLTLRR